MNDEMERREFARRLFGTKPEPDKPGNPKDGNLVPNEGNNPTPPRSGDDLREFARQLFARD